MSILKSLHIIKKTHTHTKVNNDGILVHVLKYKSKLDSTCPINECLPQKCVYIRLRHVIETHSVDEGSVTKKQT